MKLPSAGCRSRYSGSLCDQGYGYLWSSSFSGLSPKSLRFYSTGADLSNFTKQPTGLSVRCIKDKI
ncbi:hypothetical protein MNB_ARC-1_1298 [hydrothermal vent metagenome]|uniref:Fibrobacter succinogenes major paralogous domain-containing protein n=1 Tax=hydrothermal vent metagenome TaxID=652676 RepID=A0A3B1E7L3_9ZZZZ